MEITYVALKKGFDYLTVVIDWYNRCVISWELSITMDKGFCTRYLDRTLRKGTPGIFNTDQGSQYTSYAFFEVLNKSFVRISIDGKGSASNNIVIGRLSRTVKYGNVYLNDNGKLCKAHRHLEKYLYYDNNERHNSSIDTKTPSEIYHKNRKGQEVSA